MSDTPFPGLAPNLIPNPPSETPEAFNPGNAMESASPFSEPLDYDQIVKNLVLDRPLKLFIPDKHLYPDYEFRIINSIPQEIADAHNKGFREVTDSKMVELFRSLVAGTDKDGKAFRPLLFARPKKVGEVVRNRVRAQLASLNAGMDPANKEFHSKYADNAGTAGGTKGVFGGAGFSRR